MFKNGPLSFSVGMILGGVLGTGITIFALSKDIYRLKATRIPKKPNFGIIFKEVK